MRLAIASATAIIALSSATAGAQDMRAETCASLSQEASAMQVAVRSNNRHLLIRDGDAHYRLDLFRTNDFAPMAAPIRVVSNGQSRSLCLDGKTVVKDADGRVFWVGRTIDIDAESHAQLMRNPAKPGQVAWQASLAIGD